jgi:hypothetical protein
MQVDDYADADGREVNPPLEVESATRSTGGTLDWWVRERQEWWDRVAVKTVVNDAIRGNDRVTRGTLRRTSAESQVHLLLACRFDKSVDQRRRRAGEGQVPWPALTASGGVGLLGGLISLGGAEFRLCSLVCLASRPCKP